MVDQINDNEPEYGYCQNCGDWIDEDNLYVTSRGDVYCRRCGRGEDEAIEKMEAEEAEEWGWMGFELDDEDGDSYDGWDDGSDEDDWEDDELPDDAA